MEPINSTPLIKEPHKIVEYSDFPLSEEKYQGCNAEAISDSQHCFKLPRALYHLLFINFAFKGRVQQKKAYDYEIIEFPNGLYSMEKEQHLNDSEFDKVYNLCYERSKIAFHRDVISYFKDKNVDPLSLKWSDAIKIVKDIWASFPRYNVISRDNTSKFSYSFYRFIYRSDIRERALGVLLKCISLEWSQPQDVTLLYRSATMKKEALICQNGDSQSLSFASSPLSGAVFEGGACGTCPLVYQLEYPRDFYALKLSTKKLERYFFNPPILKGLYPLVAMGEFSHQRIRTYPSNREIAGVQGCYQEAKKLVVFDPKSKSSMQSYANYEAKILSIYSKQIALIERSPYPQEG